MKVVLKIKSLSLCLRLSVTVSLCLSLLLCLLGNLSSTASEDSNTFHGIHLILYNIIFADNKGVKLNGGVETSSLSLLLSHSESSIPSIHLTQ